MRIACTRSLRPARIPSGSPISERDHDRGEHRCRASPCSRPRARGPRATRTRARPAARAATPPNSEAERAGQRRSRPASRATRAGRRRRRSRAATAARIGSRTCAVRRSIDSRWTPFRRPERAARRRCGAASTGPGTGRRQDRRDATARTSDQRRGAPRRRAGPAVAARSPVSAIAVIRRRSPPAIDGSRIVAPGPRRRRAARRRRPGSASRSRPRRGRPSGSPRRTGTPARRPDRRPSPARMTQRRVRTCDFGMSRTKSSTYSSAGRADQLLRPPDLDDLAVAHDHRRGRRA